MLLSRVLARQSAALRSNPAVAILLIFTAAAVLYLGFVHDNIVQSVVYLMAMLLCAFVTDIFTIGKPAPHVPVRHPARESIVLLLCTALGITGMMLRFVWLDWEATPGPLRLLTVVLIFGFTFPVAQALFLLLSRYKLRDLGLRLTPLILLGLAAAAITGLAAWIAGEPFQFDAIMKEVGGSILAMFVMGFIQAALPEEAMRFFLQTRLGACLRNPALGWFLACIPWAFLHAPKWYGESGDLFEAIMGSVRIVPIGLMWSYLIYRTKSIIPSIAAHGLNIWGLQNF